MTRYVPRTPLAVINSIIEQRKQDAADGWVCSDEHGIPRWEGEPGIYQGKKGRWFAGMMDDYGRIRQWEFVEDSEPHQTTMQHNSKLVNLLKLPREVRNNIYKYLVPQDETISIEILHPYTLFREQRACPAFRLVVITKPQSHLTSKREGTNTMTFEAGINLRLVCGLLNEEMGDFMFEKNRFKFDSMEARQQFKLNVPFRYWKFIRGLEWQLTWE